VSSLRPRHEPDRNAAGVEGGDYRLPRDPAVDSTTPNGFANVGLAGNPDAPVVLGRQTSTRGQETPVGRPGRFHTLAFRPQARNLNREQRGTLAPGTIRRNVEYAINGMRGIGFFSWAANELGNTLGFAPARPPQDEYLVSSLHLQLPDSLATVVSETQKPAPGLEPFRQNATVQAGASTGWPVLAPQIPSYGSRVPLRRPRGLVTTETGA
jgi:hypothetical protein